MPLPVYLVSNIPGFLPDLADVLRIFVGETETMAQDAAELTLCHEHVETEDAWVETCTVSQGGRAQTHVLEAEPVQGALAAKRHLKRAIKRCCYALLKGFYDTKPTWGSLTGIRPTRLLYEEYAADGDLDAAKDRLVRLYDLDADKAGLLAEIFLTQQGMMEEDPQAVDIYVGIPFCRTRCAYCSFISEEIAKGQRIPAYLEALSREVEAARDIVQEGGLRVRALYVGGGTPTALTVAQLSGVLAQLGQAFPQVAEYTVEGGRPDTLSEEMLRMLREYPVTRLSINPQTLHDVTLARIGRDHTAAEVPRAMEQARALGFDNINMDIIAALPGENLEDFTATLDGVAAMHPESLTVHTLAVKRASKLRFEQWTQAPPEEVGRMVELARERAHDQGMRAYYLYRQKYMAGNLENVGYALSGRACRYNIDHMEETTSILALGAGGISKRLFNRELRIERAPNVSNIDHYVGRIGEMIDRKRALWA